jgi:hypothetical protein
MKAAHNYKALYNNCTKESAEKDRLIVLIQLQLMQLAGERQSLTAVLEELQIQLKNQEQQINDQQLVLAGQQQTINGQAEKILKENHTVQKTKLSSHSS